MVENKTSQILLKMDHRLKKYDLWDFWPFW